MNHAIFEWVIILKKVNWIYVQFLFQGQSSFSIMYYRICCTPHHTYSSPKTARHFLLEDAKESEALSIILSCGFHRKRSDVSSGFRGIDHLNRSVFDSSFSQRIVVYKKEVGVMRYLFPDTFQRDINRSQTVT